MTDNFNGLGLHLGNLSRLSAARSRSISAENFDGAKGQGGMAQTGTGAGPARDLGQGWKVSPSISIEPGEVRTLADIEGAGAIQQIWMTPSQFRRGILRFYWDGQEHPSVECPVGDFFAHATEHFSQLSSLAVCVNPRNGLNCYWEMPFRESCRITIENLSVEPVLLYYQINYALTDVPDDCAYFHAQFRRVNPLPYKEVFTILDNVRGRGHYVGTYMFWGANNCGWWGEGEIKFFLDGDDEFPTICGTGTEDYFGGAYCFDVDGNYREFSTPYAGLSQVMRPDGFYFSQQRFGMYRWHILDPIRFETDLRVTMQALGWRQEPNARYLPLQDDISAVAYWYQTLPSAPFAPLPAGDELDIV